jgi:hypothetical protein
LSFKVCLELVKAGEPAALMTASEDCSFYLGAVAGRADDCGIDVGLGFGGEFRWCAHIRNYLVLVCDECVE